MGTFFTKISKIEIRKRTKQKLMKNQLKIATNFIEKFKKTYCFSTRNDQFPFLVFFCEVAKKTRGLKQNPLNKKSRKITVFE